MSDAIERLQQFCVVGLFDAYPDGKHSIIDDVQHVISLAIAAGTQRAETSETSAPSEGCQSGPKGIAPNTPANHPRST